MSEKFIAAGVSVALGIIGVAVIAMLVSRQADTSKVITASAGGFGCVLKTALTGVNQCGGDIFSVDSNVKYPGSGGSGGRFQPF